MLAEARQALRQGDFRRAHTLCIGLLQADVGCAEALFLLAVLAAEHGNFAKAAELIARVLAIDDRPAEYHAQLARCQVALQRPRQALEAARRALTRAPNDAYTFDTVGVALTRAGAHAEAVTPFRAAVARAPGVASYQYNLGAALQFVGDFAGAEVAYRQALRADPGHYRAWSALAQVVTPALSAAEVATLQSRLDAGGLDSDAELHLCHALAKQAEDSGQPDTAMTLLRRGKARKRAGLDYDFATDAALFDAAEASIATGRATAGHPSPEPIFIIGMPRTGTTLVERILSSHPQVFAAGELGHFGLALKRATATPSRFVLDPETLQAAAGIDTAALGLAYLDSTRPRTGHTAHFIDKMPLNLFYAAVIRRALPNARILCLRRHPLDTCLSNYRQLFATGFSYYNYAYNLADCGRFWLRFDRLCQRYAAALGEAWCEVHYEDVVADLETQARRLLAFCGLPWDPVCIDFHCNAAPVATASSVQVRQPLYSRAVGRWQHYGAALDPLREVLGEALPAWEAGRR